MPPPRRRAIARKLFGIQLARRAHRVEHVGTERAADHVGVVAGRAEALIVGDRHGPAAREHHRDQARLPIETAGQQARRRRRVADAVRADRVADQGPRPAHAPVGHQQRSRHGSRLADRRRRAIEHPPGLRPEADAGDQVGIHRLGPDHVSGLAFAQVLGRNVEPLGGGDPSPWRRDQTELATGNARDIPETHGTGSFAPKLRDDPKLRRSTFYGTDM